MNDKIEKAIAAAVESVLDDILDLQEQVDQIQRTPGPKGDPGDIVPVAEVSKFLLENHPDKVRGEKGEPGQSAPTVQQLSDYLLSDAGFIKCVEQNSLAIIERSQTVFERVATRTAEVLATDFIDVLKGADGKDGKDAPPLEVDIDDVCAALLASDDFRALSKGEKGDTPSIEAFTEAFHKTFGESLRGEPGKDAPQITVHDAAKALKSDPEFRALLKGEKGDQGDKGEAPSVEAVVEMFHKTHGESLRGAPGKDADPEHVTKLLKTDPAFISSIKGEKGERGEAGEVGSGIEAPCWTKGVYREGVTVQHFVGRYYRALRDTAEEPGYSDDWERVGFGGFRFLGECKSLDKSKLVDGDIYSVSGSSYLWSQGKSFVLAGAGEKGADGKDGAQGIAGKDAPFIVDGEFSEKGIVFAMSDGSLVDCDVSKFSDFLGKLIQQSTVYALDHERKVFESRGVPMNSFIGGWSESTHYQRGDVVVASNALWACKKNIQGRFNPDDWTRIFQMPSAGTVKKVKDLKKQSVGQIPMNKPPGENLNACVAALLKNELIEYDIQCWNDSESFLPILRFASYDPTVLIQSKDVHVITAYSQNQTKQEQFNTVASQAVLDGVGFLLVSDEISAGEKVLSKVSVDKRNPDYDTIDIESRYRSVDGCMMTYRLSAWIDKNWTVSFIGFGAESDTNSHWRAFHR